MKIFNRKEAAEFLGVSLETIDRKRKSGELSFRKIGDRVVLTEDDLITLIENCKISAKNDGGEK